MGNVRRCLQFTRWTCRLRHRDSVSAEAEHRQGAATDSGPASPRAWLCAATLIRFFRIRAAGAASAGFACVLASVPLAASLPGFPAHALVREQARECRPCILVRDLDTQWGCRPARRVRTEGTRANSIDWRGDPQGAAHLRQRGARRSASASSSRSRITSMCSTRMRACGVRLLRTDPGRARAAASAEHRCH